MTYSSETWFSFLTSNTLSVLGDNKFLFKFSHTKSSMWQLNPDRDLRVSLVQTELHWNQPKANRAMLEESITPLCGITDLILLPEMFTSGFALEPSEIDLEKDYEHTCAWMIEQASKTGAALCGSVLYQRDDKRHNRFLFASPTGDLWHYDKTHLFRMAGEHERYQAGKERKVFDYLGWRILPTVCYDLRFPVFMRNRGDYDLMVCVANWPASRRKPWRTLLQARSIENLSYVAGVNRVGQDGKGLDYSGDSMIIDFKGDHLIDHPENHAFVETAALSASKLASFREEFPAWQDADGFSLDHS